MQYFNEIQQIICMEEGINPAILQSKTRKEKIVFARQLVMYFLKQYVKNASWAEIGGCYFKDHATAIHSIKTINNYIETDKVKALKIANYEIRIEAILNFEKNVITDKLVEIKEILKSKIDNNMPISYESIIIYNKVLENNVNMLP